MITINLGNWQNVGLNMHRGTQKAAKMSFFKALNKTLVTSHAGKNQKGQNLPQNSCLVYVGRYKGAIYFGFFSSFFFVFFTFKTCQ